MKRKQVTYAGHTTAYLCAGPEDGPAMIFVHGWPELSHSWRHQLPVFAALGFRVIAPDLRGYGQSSQYPKTSDYRLECLVADMIGLVDQLNIPEAIWVGHDWGSPVIWSVARHYPERCRGLVSLCVPYAHLELGLDHVINLVDREVYPQDVYPAGQWEYQKFYEESFESATEVFEADTRATLRALFRKGDPEGKGLPAATAETRRQGGWFGGQSQAPDLPLDEAVISEADLAVYAEALNRNGFFGPDAFYVNHDANAQYAARSVNQGRLSMPVLFLAARFDYVCETLVSKAAEPMRKLCSDLQESVIDSGHWMAQEQPVAVNRAISRWLNLQGWID